MITSPLAAPSSDLASKPPSRVKSPPLAFERTSNDMLVSPSFRPHFGEDGSLASPSLSALARLSPGEASEQHLQVIVDQQANAIQLLHEAFAAERQVWSLEKERLYQRIASLEKLLRNGDHYSPAKSPVISPTWSGGLASPQPRSLSASHLLPTIKEDDKTPLSSRRAGAPQSIELPSIPERSNENRGSVSFTDDQGVIVEEIPASPARAEVLSPPPADHRILAGSTPIRIPRKPTPPPANMTLDGIEDTPTRNNTHINTYLTQTNDEDLDRELKGPLNMPELPSNPSDANFTLEALSKRLEQLENDPEQSKPLIFATPSPGLASPKASSNPISPGTVAKSPEGPHAPHSTLDATVSTADSNVETPSTTAAAAASSPSNVPKSPLDEAEKQLFEQGGIKLKKKTSINFGAPFGQLAGGFTTLRKLS